jgi:hypothetical protein
VGRPICRPSWNRENRADLIEEVRSLAIRALQLPDEDHRPRPRPSGLARALSRDAHASVRFTSSGPALCLATTGRSRGSSLRALPQTLSVVQRPAPSAAGFLFSVLLLRARPEQVQLKLLAYRQSSWDL